MGLAWAEKLMLDYRSWIAGVAQSVEQLIRNEKVEGSIPFSGTNRINNLASGGVWGFVVFRSRTD
jgi:hypothetical protein